MELILILIIAVLVYKLVVLDFKVSYYEHKLKNRGVDISSVENISLLQIIKL